MGRKHRLGAGSRRWVAAGCAAAVLGGVMGGVMQGARADLLDPDNFTSTGLINLTAGTYTVNTSGTPTMTIGGLVFTGVVVSQGGSLPQLAVFTFSEIGLGDGAVINVTGSRGVAILSQGDITMNGTSSVAVAPGAGGFSITGPGEGQSGTIGGGGGGGFGGAGGAAATGGGLTTPGGNPYGDLLTAAEGGGPGGQGGEGALGGTAGTGGGVLELVASGTITMGSGATLTAIGGHGGTSRLGGGGGGGGAGGGIIVAASSINAPATAMTFVLGGGGGDQATGTDQGGGGGGGGRVLYHVASFTAGSTLVLPSPQLNGASGGSSEGSPGAFGSARLDVGTTIVPAGQVFTFEAPQVDQFTTTNVTVNAGGVAVTPGTYTNAGTVTVAGGGTFTGTGTLKGGSWVLSGAPVTALGGFTFDGTTSVTGNGTVAGKITSTGSGGSIQASGGALVMGDANVTGAINYNGAITVGASGQAASLILLAADHAVIGNTTLNAGSMSAPNGTTLRSGTTLTAATASTIGGAFTNSGTVAGPTAAGSFLTFTDDVNGAGNYTGNVKFSDGFSPGNSPADVALENVAFDNTADLTMELGGKTEGSQYDRLTISGSAALDGTLDVVLINGFVPSVGDSFLLLNGGTLSGGFANVDLPTLPTGEQWVMNQDGGSLTAAVVPEAGTLGMLVVGMAALGRRRGRRR